MTSRPPPFPVVVGAARSGTTMLRLMLDSHPELAIPPETGFLPLGWSPPTPGGWTAGGLGRALTAFPPEAPGWADFGLDAGAFVASLERLDPFSPAEAFRTFYRAYAARFGKARGGDKTPGYVQCMGEIEAMLPEARFVHLIRDGRDAAVSLRHQWFSPGPALADQARSWRTMVEAGRSRGHRCAHYLEARFEDLVRGTEVELRRLCGFLALDFDPAMLRSHERAAARIAEHQGRFGPDGAERLSVTRRRAQQASTLMAPDPARIGVHRTALTRAETREFEAVSGILLAELGYPVGE